MRPRTTQGSSETAARVGAHLRRKRERLGLSQQAVASAVGRTQAWLSYVEAGKREPRLDDLEVLLRELDLVLEIRDV